MARKSVAKRMKDGVRSLTRVVKKTAKKATRAVIPARRTQRKKSKR
jgi:hypothetical protein